VFALLLDDALKPVTPLTNGVINETLRQFAPLSDISQGSVATHSRYGGIFSDSTIANFLLIPTMKQFKKSVNILMKLRRTKHCAIFWTTMYIQRLHSNRPHLCTTQEKSPSLILITNIRYLIFYFGYSIFYVSIWWKLETEMVQNQPSISTRIYALRAGDAASY